MKLILLLLALSGILLYGCRKDDTLPKTLRLDQDHCTFPLAVGNHWEYHIEQLFTNCKDSLENPLPNDTMTHEVIMNIDSIVMIDNIPRYCLSSFTGNQWTYTIECIYPFNTEQGLMAELYGYSNEWAALFPIFPSSFYEFKNLSFQPADTADLTICLKYPLKIGTTWDTGLYKWDTLRKEVVSIEQITTAAGTFECFRIDYSYRHNSTTQITDYINNIGLIRRVTHKKNISARYPLSKKKKTADVTETKDLTGFCVNLRWFKEGFSDSYLRSQMNSNLKLIGK